MAPSALSARDVISSWYTSAPMGLAVAAVAIVSLVISSFPRRGGIRGRPIPYDGPRLTAEGHYEHIWALGSGGGDHLQAAHDHARTGLQHLEQQSLEPHEILVVDSSPDHDTERVVADFDGVRYLRHGVGRGHTASSRALGVARTSAEIVAFVDDDAYAEPDWLEQLLIPYGDQLVGGVGGRARNNQPGEESEGVDRVGLLLPDGHLTGNFAAVTPGPLDVDHLIGCNMSYRRSALE